MTPRRTAAAAGVAAAAVVWCVASYLLWRTSVPSVRLPHLDPHAFFSGATLHRTSHYASGERILWLSGTLLQLGALAAFARWGIRWARESAAGPVGTGMLLGMLGFALAWAAQLPVAVLTVWWRHRYGLGGSYVSATVGNWLALGFEFVTLCVALAIVMGLARRVGDWWWLPAAPCFVGLAALFAFATPYLLGGHPLRAPDLRAASARLERVEHVRHVPIRVLEGFDEPNAFATGLGPSRRVFLWAPIVRPPFTHREVEVVIAHELGHLAHDHIWRSLAWYALFAFPGAFLIARAVRRRGGMGTPEAVPLAILVLVALQLAALPLQSAITRRMEQEADWSALRATRDPVGARRLFERFVPETLSDPSPPTWDYVVLEDHPTIMQRLAMVDAWRRYATSTAQSP